MWNTFKNIFQRNERQAYRAYRVCVAGQSKYFVTFKEASIYAEEIDLAEPVEIYLGHRRLGKNILIKTKQSIRAGEDYDFTRRSYLYS